MKLKFCIHTEPFLRNYFLEFNQICKNHLLSLKPKDLQIFFDTGQYGKDDSIIYSSQECFWVKQQLLRGPDK